MRLFLAIELPEPVRRLVGAVQEQLRKSIRGPMKWVDPANFHLTLKFLGEVPDHRQAEIIAACNSISTAHFELQLASLGQLPPEHRAKVVIINLAEIPPELHDLHEKTEFTYEPLGFEREQRAFHPHLTLARLRVPRYVSREIAIELPAAKFKVSEFVLMQSTPGRDGSTYQALARRSLA